MIAITTRSSISVKPVRRLRGRAWAFINNAGRGGRRVTGGTSGGVAGTRRQCPPAGVVPSRFSREGFVKGRDRGLRPGFRVGISPERGPHQPPPGAGGAAGAVLSRRPARRPDPAAMSPAAAFLFAAAAVGPQFGEPAPAPGTPEAWVKEAADLREDDDAAAADLFLRVLGEKPEAMADELWAFRRVMEAVGRGPEHLALLAEVPPGRWGGDASGRGGFGRVLTHFENAFREHPAETSAALHAIWDAYPAWRPAVLDAMNDERFWRDPVFFAAGADRLVADPPPPVPELLAANLHARAATGCGAGWPSCWTPPTRPAARRPSPPASPPAPRTGRGGAAGRWSWPPSPPGGGSRGRSRRCWESRWRRGWRGCPAAKRGRSARCWASPTPPPPPRCSPSGGPSRRPRRRRRPACGSGRRTPPGSAARSCRTCSCGTTPPGSTAPAGGSSPCWPAPAGSRRPGR